MLPFLFMSSSHCQLIIHSIFVYKEVTVDCIATMCCIRWALLTVLFGLCLRKQLLKTHQKNQTVKGDWPVNVNNTSRTLKLARLLNSILHLLSHVFFILFPSSVPTNTITNLSILYPSPYLLSFVNLSASLIPSLLQDPISISTSCVLLAQQASALSNTQLLHNLWLCVCVCVFPGSRRDLR